MESAEKAGEVESLFVDAAYRSIGITSALVKRGIARMGSPATVRKRISLRAFYRKFESYPRMTLLEQKTNPDRCIPASLLYLPYI